MKKYLVRNGWLNEQQDESIRREEREQVLDSLAKAEKKPLPHLTTLFTDVYAEKPQHLQAQEDELLAHLSVYGDRY